MTKHDSPGLEIHKGDLVDHEVMYGKRISFPVWLKSTATSPIAVRAVTAELHPDNGWRGDSSRFVFRNEEGLQLAARDRDITSVAVIPTLDSLPNSNYVSISVEYD